MVRAAKRSRRFSSNLYSAGAPIFDCRRAAACFSPAIRFAAACACCGAAASRCWRSAASFRSAATFMAAIMFVAASVCAGVTTSPAGARCGQRRRRERRCRFCREWFWRRCCRCKGGGSCLPPIPASGHCWPGRGAGRGKGVSAGAVGTGGSVIADGGCGGGCGGGENVRWHLLRLRRLPRLDLMAGEGTIMELDGSGGEKWASA